MIQQKYIAVNQVSDAVGANRNGIGLILDLKTVLEGLCSEAEELVIRKATISWYLQTQGSSTGGQFFASQMILVVSDGAIADSLNVASNDLDTIVANCSAGNSEFTPIGPFRLSRPVSNNGTTDDEVIAGIGNITDDITALTRKAALRLIRSPVLSTNPLISLCFVHSIANAAGITISGAYKLEIEYLVRPRQARMLK